MLRPSPSFAFALPLLAALAPSPSASADDAPAVRPEAGKSDDSGFWLDLADASPPLVISTDRPSFSDGTGIQPRGTLNLEMGYTYAQDDAESAVELQNGPEMLFRLGVIQDRFELRAAWGGWAWGTLEEAGDRAHVDGQTDVTLGLKLKVFDQDGWIPRVAVLGQCALGVGNGDVASTEPEPTFKILWSYALPNGWTVGGNANVAAPAPGGDRFAQGQVSAYLSFPIVDRLSGFVEWFMLFPAFEGSGPSQNADAGLLYLLDDRIQLDVRVGAGLNERANDFNVGAGISFLY